MAKERLSKLQKRILFSLLQSRKKYEKIPGHRSRLDQLLEEGFEPDEEGYFYCAGKYEVYRNCLFDFKAYSSSSNSAEAVFSRSLKLLTNKGLIRVEWPRAINTHILLTPKGKLKAEELLSKEPAILL